MPNEITKHSPEAARHGSQAERRAAVASLCLAFPHFGSDEASMNAFVSLTLSVLEEVPLWALCEARRRFLAGEQKVSWNPAYCPTTPQFAIECRTVMEPRWEEEKRKTLAQEQAEWAKEFDRLRLTGGDNGTTH